MSSRPTFQVFSFSEDTIKPYKKQKTHRKTRSGCLTCKLKKVKVRVLCVEFGRVELMLTPRSATRFVQYAPGAKEMGDHARTPKRLDVLHPKMPII
jgi:hypothetical protein